VAEGVLTAAPDAGLSGQMWGRATRRKVVQFLLACAAYLPLTPCQARASSSQDPGEWDAVFDDGVPVSTYKVIRRLNHDSKAFTQGLEFDANGLLVESTGLYGESQLRRIPFDESGKVIQRKKIPKKYFGEGLTIIDDYIVMLTWKERTAFVYDKESFVKKGSFPYPYEVRRKVICCLERFVSAQQKVRSV
jgi:glutamine cyclotransferase